MPPAMLRRIILAAMIGACLYAFYFLTFSGFVRSDDERYIIDTTDSLATHGSLMLNQTVYLRGLQTSDVEPAQPLLAVPLYWLAYHIPWVGNIHAIFLFNVIVTALTGVLIFAYALRLGYDDRLATLAALLYGLTTIAWPYSKTFFREPLITFALLGSAYALECWRQAYLARKRTAFGWLGLGVVFWLLALLSKEAALILLPMLALIAYPGRSPYRRVAVVIILLAGVSLLTGLGVLLGMLDALLNTQTARYEVLSRALDFLNGLPMARYGLGGYLLTPGKSIWAYSPVLLLALLSPALLPRARWRESWLVLGMTILFALVYAAIRGEIWYGGVGWGARYMVPLTPFLMLAALPALEKAFNQGGWAWRAGVVTLTIWGLLVQIAGTVVLTSSYYDYMQAVLQQPPWGPQALWNPRWTQAIGSLLYLPQAAKDIIWLIPSPDWPMLGLLSLTACALLAGTLWLALRGASAQTAMRRAGYGALTGAAIMAGLTLVGLVRAYDDPRYLGDDQTLHTMMNYLSDNVQPDDIILLPTTSYNQFFMNYYKGRAIWYGLPVSPGERYSCEAVPEVVSDRVEDLIDPVSELMVGAVYKADIATGRPVWLIEDRGPYLPCATRPVEWYMAKYYFTNSLVEFSPAVRVLSYLPVYSPAVEARSAAVAPDTIINARFGDDISLRGYSLRRPYGAEEQTGFAPGDQIGVALLWEASRAVEQDYTVGLYLLNPAGAVVIQQDRFPMAGFAPTSTWETGQIVWDNYGLILPENLPEGMYQLWIALYDWQTLTRLPVQAEGAVIDGNALLLGSLTVQAGSGSDSAAE
ncbi:MAG: hypothetical protein IT326_00670 [Anaerolineae bacterium]|nr:hypothetical protein [Anaerolineae bacterium]